jgi:hypothetical protein
MLTPALIREGAGPVPVDDSPPRYLSNVDAVCVIASAIPVLMAATVIVLRSGYYSPVGAILRLAGIALLIVNVGAFARRDEWYYSAPVVWLATLLALAGLGFTPLGGNSTVGTILAAVGVGSFLLNLFSAVRSLGVLSILALLGLGLFLGVYAEGMYWGEGEHDTLYPEAIAAGAVHADVAFQADVLSMISTYGMATTGLDGTIPLKYHSGAFWIGEGFRRFSSLTAIEFSGFGYGLIVMPFYVVAFLGCGEFLWGMLHKKPSPLPFAFWFMATVALVGLVPHNLNVVRANFNVMNLNSDSAILSLGIALLYVALAARLNISLETGIVGSSLFENVAITLLMPLALWLGGFVKISVAYMLFGLLVYSWWRIPRLRTSWFALGVALSFIAFGMMLHAETGSLKTVVRPFSFDRVHWEWVPYFFVIHLVWAWLLAFVWMHYHRVHTFLELKEAIHSRKTLPVELVGIAAIIGLVPYLVLYLNNPAWVYFTSFHATLAGVLILPYQRELQWADLRRHYKDGSLATSILFIGALALILAGHLFISGVSSAYRMLKTNGEDRALLSGRPASEWQSHLRQIVAREASKNQHVSARQGVLECLYEVSRRPKEQRRVTAIYVPKTNRSYWDMRQLDEGTTPFLAPAGAGVAMIDGLPEYDDIGYAAIGWGYHEYHLPTGPEPPTEKLDAAVESARKKGFKKLVEFKSVSPAGCQLQDIDLN